MYREGKYKPFSSSDFSKRSLKFTSHCSALFSWLSVDWVLLSSSSSSSSANGPLRAKAFAEALKISSSMFCLIFSDNVSITSELGPNNLYKAPNEMNPIFISIQVNLMKRFNSSSLDGVLARTRKLEAMNLTASSLPPSFNDSKDEISDLTFGNHCEFSNNSKKNL